MKMEQRLSVRFEAILSLLDQVDALADIGTDHAIVPTHAVLRGKCQKAWAVDINEEPLRRAALTLKSWGVDDRVQLVCGDGLLALREVEVEAVVLAGLSGRTMITWCDAAPALIGKLRRLIVQPNSQLAALRAWAHEHGLWLVDERICQQSQRFFVTCAFEPRSGPDPAYASLDLALDRAFELGPLLSRGRDPIVGRYYEQQHNRLSRLVTAGRAQHRALLHTYKVGVERVL